MSGSRRTRKKSGAVAASPARTRARRRGQRPGMRLAILIGGLVLAGAAAWFVFRPRTAPPGGGEALGLSEALRRAQAAELSGDYEGAFSIYRAAMRRHPTEPVLVGAYAAAVSNRSFAVRPSRGRFVSLAATSHERVSTALEVLALYDQAERLRPTDAEPALQRGLAYANWGLPEDALSELYRAHLLGGTQPEIDGVGATLTLLQLGQGDVVEARAIRPAPRPAP